MLVYKNEELNFTAYTLEAATWEAFEEVLGVRGGCGGCWCMSWRLNKTQFEKQKGELNKMHMKSLVNGNEPIGIIGYINDSPIGWCSTAPREKYKRLEKSRVLKRIDDNPVWSISCLYIQKEYRRKGIATELIKAAINYGKLSGANIIEAYPTVPYDENVPDAFLWTGIPASFKAAEFVEVERRSRMRPIMRFYV